jgi:hypothetical protein
MKKMGSRSERRAQYFFDRELGIDATRERDVTGRGSMV